MKRGKGIISFVTEGYRTEDPTIIQLRITMTAFPLFFTEEMQSLLLSEEHTFCCIHSAPLREES